MECRIRQNYRFSIDFFIGFVIDFVMKIDLGIDFGIAKIDFGSIDFGMK